MTGDQPTVAIISCLFIEKQAVDSLIEDSSTVHKVSYINVILLLLGNFQRIEHVLVVGVGGAVPHYTDARLHARLGYFLLLKISTDIIFSLTISNIEFIHRRRSGILWIMLSKGSFRRVERNFLMNGTNIHWKLSLDLMNVEEIHLGSIGALASLKKHTTDADIEEESAGQIRERFAADYGVRAIDAGFDSVVAAISGSRIDSWVLVRGISDYQHGQSRASKLWLAHASARAAAMARTIIEKLPAS
uniref:PNP_UDP_1 domain-containing protein n=1 Tax=Heterorhabditis bacteriophora TaxID=37862 RepID=A0A1I7XAW4_HETBA